MPTSDWTPLVSDVGDVLRARTRDKNGVEVGTFTADTRPTDLQVEALINKGVSDVALRIGSEIPPQVWQDALEVAALGTALKVELGYYPEQVGNNRSPYQQMKQMYDDNMKALITAVESARAGGNASADPLKPVFAFPMEGDPQIIGRTTAW